MSEIDNIITAIIDNEGRRYENVPLDRGGPTKFGITLGRLQTEWGPNCTWETVRDLTEDQARVIYRDAYYFRPKIDRLPECIEHVVMDWFTTSGTWAIKGLQRVLNEFGFECDVDGKIGPQVVRQSYACLAKTGETTFINAYCWERARFYKSIVAGRPSQVKFLRGWLARAARFEIKEDKDVANAVSNREAA